MKSDETRLNALLARLVDETIAKEEIVELESLLDKNPRAQSHYIQYIGLHEDLAESTTIQNSVTDRSGKNTSPLRVPLAILAAAMSLIAIGLYVFYFTPPDPIAEIVVSGGSIRWVKQDGEINRELKPGFTIRKGWIETMGADSWAEIRFFDDTTVQISGIAKLHLESLKGQKKLNLTSGNISVDASPQPKGKPLLLSTPAAEAEVLGTQFNVVASDFSTRLEVNEGLVKVKRLADGLTEEVKPNHQVIAALESDTEFVARPRKQSASHWNSQLPRDILQGRLTERGTVRAQTHLWRGDKALNETLERPVLLHTVVLDPSAKRMPPLRIESGRHLIVTGKVTKPELINIGFATHRLKGGFSGKYRTSRRAKSENFSFEIPLSEMKRKGDTFPESPVGHEMIYLWIQTVRSDAGLEVESVELSE